MKLLYTDTGYCAKYTCNWYKPILNKGYLKTEGLRGGEPPPAVFMDFHRNGQ